MPRRVRISDCGGAIFNTGEKEKEKCGKENGSQEKHDLRIRSTCASIKAYFKEYCNATGVHGVRYLAEDNRLFIEKLFWIIALTMCITGCTLMIIKIREKLDTIPVMVTFAETPTQVWNLPFPAVTVCPETKSRQTIFNYTKYRKIFLQSWFKNLTLEEQTNTFSNETRKNLNALDLVCNFKFNEQKKEVIGSDFTIDEESLKFLQTSTITPKNVECERNDKHKDSCNLTLKHVWSEEGVCFTFNMMDDNLLYRSHVVNNQIFGDNLSDVGSDWDPDKGYNLNAGVESRPWRASGAGSQNSIFYVILSEGEEDVDYVCRWASTGYKIILHSPAEMPLQKSNVVVDVPFDKTVTISLYPKYMTTSSGLENYDPHKRQCYFSHEKYLQHFRFYTQKSCEIECLTNETLSLCGCVQFYMPRNSSTKICGPKSSNCTDHVSQVMKQRDIDIDLEQRAAGKPPGSMITKCDCLPSCVSLEYEADTNQKVFDITAGREALGLKKPDAGLHIAVVAISFKNSQFIATSRSELYGKIDFLANCGGILGLFSGFSIVSLIELIYFLTIRLWSNMYHRLKSDRATSNKMTENQN